VSELYFVEGLRGKTAGLEFEGLNGRLVMVHVG
jgi:hypothetical protein